MLFFLFLLYVVSLYHQCDQMIATKFKRVDSFSAESKRLQKFVFSSSCNGKQSVHVWLVHKIACSWK